MTIYKSAAGKKKILELYDKQLERLGTAYSDIRGKSAEVSLSARNYDYGKWAGEVISAIGYESICCFGGSFGAGILAKAMCAAPRKIRRAVLYVPAGIKNAPMINSMSMMFPMIMYWITHEDRWLKKI